MIYIYECIHCSKKYELIKPALQSSQLEYCPVCHFELNKVFTAPRINMGKGYEPSYNPAFGKVIHNKAELKDTIKKLNDQGRDIQEVGNDSLESFKGPTPKSYDDDIVDNVGEI